MSDLLITNAIVFTPDKIFSGWVYCKDGIIYAVGQGETDLKATQTIDAEGQRLLPGFIDVHVHGAMGHDVMDGNPDGLKAMARFFASKGVTSFTPTTLTSSHEHIMAALKAIKSLMNEVSDGSRIVGTHLEGPYLNIEKSGAQNPDFVRPCNPSEAQQYFDQEVLKIVSLAPEIEENHWLIEQCLQAGITASIAHTSASYEETMENINRGISHSTHTYNAMTPLHHRDPGVVGAVLSDNRVMCELIADNIHVHPGAMKTLWRVKGRDRVVLITDAMRATGMPEGEYRLDDLTATVKDGRVTLANGTLAGSVLTMDVAIRNFMSATGESLHTILPTFSLNPAKALGLDDKLGSIEVGKSADLVIANAHFEVSQTFIAGKSVYKRA